MSMDAKPYWFCVSFLLRHPIPLIDKCGPQLEKNKEPPACFGFHFIQRKAIQPRANLNPIIFKFDSTMPATTENDITTIVHATSGASCKIHSFGATVLSFVSADGRENLFVSPKAKLDGTKAVRGGIPIVFPIFGPPSHPADSTMPQHGFARVNRWELVSTYDREDSAGATYQLELKDVTAGRGENNPWSVQQSKVDGTDCKLTYEIRIEARQLTTTLVIQNTGTDAFDFQCLLHTYLNVDDGAAFDKSRTSVHGLGGYAITDKVTGESGHIQSYDQDEDVALAGQGTGTEETDRVYIHPDDHPTIHALVKVGCKDNRRIRLEAAGQVDGNVSPVSCVVWNPGTTDKASKMSDYDAKADPPNMICVEPGLVGHQPILAPGAEARLTQSITLEEAK